MTIICATFGSVIGLLVILSEYKGPAHKETVLWAMNLVAKYTGPSGYRKLVTFSVDCGHAAVTWKLTCLQQKKANHIEVASACQTVPDIRAEDIHIRTGIVPVVPAFPAACQEGKEKTYQSEHIVAVDTVCST